MPTLIEVLKVSAQFVLCLVGFALVFGAAGLALSFFLQHLATQPYYPDRVLHCINDVCK